MLKKRQKTKTQQKKRPKNKKIEATVVSKRTKNKTKQKTVSKKRIKSKIKEKKIVKKTSTREKVKVKKNNNCVKTKKPIAKQRKKFKRVEVECLLTGVKKILIHKKAVLLCKKLNFTTIDIFKLNFLSREACKLLKQGFSEDEIKLKFNFSNNISVPFETIRRYIPAFNYKEKMLRKRKRKIVNDIVDIQNSANKIVAEYNPVVLDLKNAEHMSYLTKDVCLRPDIHLDGDYSCNLCPHYTLCACTRRHWNKKLDKYNDKPNKKSKRL